MNRASYFIGKSDGLSIFIYNYRFIYLFIGITTFYFLYIYKINFNLFYRRISIISSVIYFVYLIISLILKYREKYPNLLHRIIRINIDFIYISFIALTIYKNFNLIILIYTLPLVTSINYKGKQNYIILTFWPIFYLSLVKIISDDFLINKTTFFIIAFYVLYFLVFTIIIFLFDKNRFEIFEYSSKIKNFYQSIKISDHYCKTLDNLLSHLISVVGADLISVHYYDKSKNDLFVVDTAGVINNEIMMKRQKVNEGIVGMCYFQKEKINVKDVNIEDNYIKIDNSIKSEYAIPIDFGANIKGVLNFESRKKDYFNDLIILIIDIVIDHFIAIVKNANELYREELNFRQLIDRYRENCLYVRNTAHDLRDIMHSICQLPKFLSKDPISDWDLPYIKEISTTNIKALDKFEKSLNKAIYGKSFYKPTLKKVTICEIFSEIKNIIFLALSESYTKYEEKVITSNMDKKSIYIDKDYVISIIQNILINSINAYKKLEILNQRYILQLHRKITPTNLLHIWIKDFAGGIEDKLMVKINDISLPSIEGQTGLNIIKRYMLMLKGKLSYSHITDKNGNKGTQVDLFFKIDNGKKSND